MAGNKDTRKAALSSHGKPGPSAWPLAISKSKTNRKEAFSSQHPRQAGTFGPRQAGAYGSAVSQTRKTKGKTTKQSHRADPIKRKRRGGQFLRFREARGKTVDFVEMYTDADFPCVEVAFTDKTAFLVEMDTRLSMEPVYSDWKTGDQRLLRRWPARVAT